MWGNREIWGLVESLMRRYDTNRTGRLERTEAENLDPNAPLADSDGDGRIDRGELYRWLVLQRESAAPPLPEGLPDWFTPRDRNGDGQIVMSEFADQWDEATAAEFATFDLNNDGIIVPDECLKAAGHRLHQRPVPGDPRRGNRLLENRRPGQPPNG